MHVPCQLPTNCISSNFSSICYYNLHGVGSLYGASYSFGHYEIKEIMGACWVNYYGDDLLLDVAMNSHGWDVEPNIALIETTRSSNLILFSTSHAASTSLSWPSNRKNCFLLLLWPVHTSHYNNNKAFFSRLSCISTIEILLMGGNWLFWFILIPIKFIVLSPVSFKSLTSLRIVSIFPSYKANLMVWASMFGRNIVTWFLIAFFKLLMKH